MNGDYASMMVFGHYDVDIIKQEITDDDFYMFDMNEVLYLSINFYFYFYFFTTNNNSYIITTAP
jgi:hypothetical protein